MINVLLRKAVVFFMFGYAAVAAANWADDAKMAREALGPFVRSSLDEGTRIAKIEGMHAKARDIAGLTPDKEVAASVAFSTGVSVEKLAALVESKQLEVMSLHIKTPYNDRGAIQSIIIGSYELSRHDGDFAARAKRAIGIVRYNFLEWSQSMPPKEAELHLAMAKGRMMIYGCEIYGRAADVASLLGQSEIAAVFADPSARAQRKIEEFERLRERAIVAWETRKQQQAER